MKKILFVIPSLGGGGAERVLVTLLNNLDKTKYDITLFLIFGGGINRSFLDKSIKCSSYFKKPFKGNIHVFKLFSPERLYRIMIKDEYDIIVSYLEGPTTRIVAGCPYDKTKLINWVHSELHNSEKHLKSYRNKDEYYDVYKEYLKTIFVSNTARITFINTFKDIESEKVVIYNTVDSQMIKVKSEDVINDIEINNKIINLISVGRLIKLKGYERLIRIIHRLKKDFDLHLYLLGTGDLEIKLKELTKELGVENNITFLGFKDNPYKYVKACDLFVCSSYREGYSTAVTESLIVGTPVVTTLCSGMEEMLGTNNEYGLITSNNEESLYKGIQHILTEPDLLKNYRIKAKHRGEYFSKDRAVKAVEELLDNL